MTSRRSCKTTVSSTASPYALGIAMAEIETHFDADAVSSTSDYGLMQINKCNHDWLLKEGFDVTTYDREHRRRHLHDWRLYRDLWRHRARIDGL